MFIRLPETQRSPTHEKTAPGPQPIAKRLRWLTRYILQIGGFDSIANTYIYLHSRRVNCMYNVWYILIILIPVHPHSNRTCVVKYLCLMRGWWWNPWVNFPRFWAPGDVHSPREASLKVLLVVITDTWGCSWGNFKWRIWNDNSGIIIWFLSIYRCTNR